MTTLDALAAELLAAHPPTAELWLAIDDLALRVRSSSAELCAELGRYFGELVVAPRARAHAQVTLLEAPAPPVSLALRDWPREPGKSGSKERYADVSGGRLVVKVRTGMQFVLTARERVAIGPCRRHLNQTVNFIIAQYLSRRLDEGWALCHAAAVALGPAGLAIAARAGSGKSTLALHLLSAGLSFVSNDRLLIQHAAGRCEALGVPKMPRVNPGTLLHNPDLAGLASPERRAALLALPASELWALEDKCDVPLEEIFGRGRSVYRVPLRALLVLGWSVDAEAPTRFESIDLATRADLLEQVMKSPGVFYPPPLGAAPPTPRPEPGAYLRALQGVVVYEVTGRVDFGAGVRFCRRLLER